VVTSEGSRQYGTVLETVAETKQKQSPRALLQLKPNRRAADIGTKLKRV
jgi:hypothetical protein